MDTASNGNFLNRDVVTGWELVENLAVSDGNYSEDFDRSVRGPSSSSDKTKQEIQSLSEKLDKLILAQQKSVNFVGEVSATQAQEGDDDQVEEILYI